MTSHTERFDQLARETTPVKDGDRRIGAPKFADVASRDGVEPMAGKTDANAHVRDLTQVVLHGVLDDLHSGRRLEKRIADGLRQTCDAAREHGLRAEELLVILKQSWHHLADTQFADRHDADATLSHLVTKCIREFYRPESGVE